MSDEFDPKRAIEGINNTLNSSDRFAQLLERTLRESKIADKSIRKIIIELLKEDKNCRTEVEKILREYDKQENIRLWRSAIGKVMFAGWSILLLVVPVVVQHYFK